MRSEIIDTPNERGFEILCDECGITLVRSVATQDFAFPPLEEVKKSAKQALTEQKAEAKKRGTQPKSNLG